MSYQVFACVIIFSFFPLVLVGVVINDLIEAYKSRKWCAIQTAIYLKELNEYVPTLRNVVATRPAIKPSLLTVAKQGLSSANKGNPFWNKSDAMKTINLCRVA